MTDKLTTAIIETQHTMEWLIEERDRLKEDVSALEAQNKGLVATNKRLMEAVDECREWFLERADADCDQDGQIPNAELRMVGLIDHIIDHIMGWSY